MIPTQASVPTTYLDWRKKSEAQQQQDLDQLLVEDRRKGIPLEVAPLFRNTTIRTGE